MNLSFSKRTCSSYWKNYKRNLANHNEPRQHLREEIQVNKLKKEKKQSGHTSHQPRGVVIAFFELNECTLGVDATKCPAKLTRKLPRNNYVYRLI